LSTQAVAATSMPLPTTTGTAKPLNRLVLLLVICTVTREP